MTQEQIKDFQAAASLGLIPDEENPIFLFSQTHTDLLVDILDGGIDPIQMAKRELATRGRNEKGKFIGFKKVMV